MGTTLSGPMTIVDAHCHLIERKRFRYDWLATVPPLDRDAPLDDYLPQARAAGIGPIVFMEVDVAPEQAGDEARWAASMAPITAVVASCRPEAQDFPAQLERLADIPKVAGLRRVLHTEVPGTASEPPFPDNIRRLAAYGFSFDLCIRPDQISEAALLVRACPDVSFVLDHCANPPLGNGDLASWREGLASLAALPNLVCKLSGLINHAGAGWSDATLWPAIGWALEHFGSRRLLWGSDWPVCTVAGSLADWVDATRRALAGLSEEERHDVLAATAARTYRLGT